MDELCTICHKTRADHGDMVHAFSGPDENVRLRPNKLSSESSSSSAPIPQGSIGIAMRGDPVLRLALIRAGLITPADLDKIEAELRVSGLASAAPATVD